MNTQDPAQSADLSPVDERVQPDSPLSGEVKRGGDVQIYFIRATTLGLIKIGKATCAHRRLAGLRTMSPDSLDLLGIVLCNEGGALEKKLHVHFRQAREHGEWFRPTPALLAYIDKAAREPRPPKTLTLLERRQRSKARRDRKAARELAAGVAEWDREFGFGEEARR